MSVEQAALGYVRVANEAMCRPIRALMQVRQCAHGRRVSEAIYCRCVCVTYLTCDDVRAVFGAGSWPVAGQAHTRRVRIGGTAGKVRGDALCVQRSTGHMHT
jgi:hypothetical protein